MTSVPAAERVAATTCAGSRPAIISGIHSASSARVVAVLEAVEQRLRGQGLVAGAHVGAAVLAGDEADVRDRGDELLGRAGQALADQVRPELAGHLELLVDRDGLGRVDPAVGARRACSSARRGPSGRCRRCSRPASSRPATSGGGLEDGDAPLRRDDPDQGGERGAHDAAADEDDVGVRAVGYRRRAGKSLLPLWLRTGMAPKAPLPLIVGPGGPEHAAQRV